MFEGLTHYGTVWHFVFGNVNLFICSFQIHITYKFTQYCVLYSIVSIFLLNDLGIPSGYTSFLEVRSFILQHGDKKLVIV